MHTDAEHRLLAAELPDDPARDLAAKEAAALEIVDLALDAAGPEGLAVAWTGGKDSTLALALARARMAERHPGVRVRALSIDTGCKFPEVVAFRDRMADEWNLDLHVVRPEVDLAHYPVAVDKITCCRDLKVRPLARALRDLNVRVLVTGIRADEHPSRAATPPAEPQDSPPHIRLHPVLRFTEMDIWAYLMDRALPSCPLYAQGYRSLGCVPCTAPATTTERSGRDQDKEADMQALRSLGYF